MTKPFLYEPALDGLRLVAFLAVFFHHLPMHPGAGALTSFHSHGWSGVELFFVISSFLLFRLLDAEHRRTGTIRIGSFYVRRILRVYPLMAAFSVAMFLAFSDWGRHALFRLAGILTFSDNVISAFRNYNIAIPNTGHLWTLGFEFQFYLVLPFVFLAWKRFGTAHFLLGMAAVYAVCVAARTTMTAMGVPHPAVWVMPILQPDAILFGIVLATGALSGVPRPVWPVLFVAALSLFLMISPPWTGPVQAIFSYALIAVACGALVQSVRTIPPLNRLFAYRPVVYLGTISFGLYVFHSVCIELASRVLTRITGAPGPADAKSFVLLAGLALLATIVASALSYRFLELPFLRLKDRFSVVLGRRAVDEDGDRPPSPGLATGVGAGSTLDGR